MNEETGRFVRWASDLMISASSGEAMKFINFFGFFMCL